MFSVFGLILFFLILSYVIKTLGQNGRRRTESSGGSNAWLIFLLLMTGLFPIAIIVWGLTKASKGSRNNEIQRHYRNNGYQNMNQPNQYRPGSPERGSSPYGSSVTNYRTGMNPSVPNGYRVNNGGAYYTGYTTRPNSGTHVPSYQDQARNISNAYNNAINYSGIYNNQKPNSYGLPSAAKKRTKIVKKFSDKYDLYLTDREIKRIVDASYLSSGWAREICYMDQKYDTIYAWYAAMNPWLKVYLYAFQQQEISSDFAMQERIVYDAFNTVFSDICNDHDITIDQAIRRINEKYLTNFDETSFMIAYRYMESKGKRYSFAFNQVLNTHEDIDELLSKYESEPSGTPLR